MKSRSVFFLAGMCAALGACGLTTANHSGSLPPDQQVVISALGLYPEKKLSLQVISVDGKKVGMTRTSEILVAPGDHQVELSYKQDIQYGYFETTGNVAVITVPLTAVAGHTYIPNADLHPNNVFFAYFNDMGPAFNKECLPLRRFAIFYGGRADGKKPGC